MTDTADRILNDLRARRDELRPLVGELDRIEAAIDALERVDVTSNGNGNGAAPQSAGTAPQRRRGRPRKGEPNRADQFLALVRRGSISIPDAARELGIGPNYLYRIAGTLESEGTIRKDGREFVLAVGDGDQGGDASDAGDDDPKPAPTEGDDDLVTEEGVNEGTGELATE
jgi:hypothetical protein